MSTGRARGTVERGTVGRRSRQSLLDDRYRPTAWWAAGRPARVYRARDVLLDREVAVKVLPAVARGHRRASPQPRRDPHARQPRQPRSGHALRRRRRGPPGRQPAGVPGDGARRRADARRAAAPRTPRRGADGARRAGDRHRARRRPRPRHHPPRHQAGEPPADQPGRPRRPDAARRTDRQARRLRHRPAGRSVAAHDDRRHPRHRPLPQPRAGHRRRTGAGERRLQPGSRAARVRDRAAGLLGHHGRGGPCPARRPAAGARGPRSGAGWAALVDDADGAEERPSTQEVAAGFAALVGTGGTLVLPALDAHPAHPADGADPA